MTPIHGLTSGMELTASCSQEGPWASVGLLQWSLCILQLSVLEGWGILGLSQVKPALSCLWGNCGFSLGAFFPIILLVSWLILPLEGEFYWDLYFGSHLGSTKGDSRLSVTLGLMFMGDSKARCSV